MIFAIHIVIGRGHDEGPMGFDIADMSAPWPLGLFDEIDGAVGQPGRLAVFLANVGRLVRIFEHPARGDLTVCDPCIGEIGPRVLALIALRLQVFIIGAAFLVIKPIWPIAPKPIVPDPDVKPAFRLPRADHRVRRKAQPRHALGIGLHMGLADQPTAHPRLAQMIAHGQLPDPQGIAIPRRSMGRDIAARIAAHARRAADGRLNISIGKAHAHRRHTVEIRGMQMRMARTA